MKYKVGEKFLGATDSLSRVFEFEITEVQEYKSRYTMSYGYHGSMYKSIYIPSEAEIEKYLRNYQLYTSPLFEALK